MEQYKILIRPLLSEKTTDIRETLNKYTFKVAKDANKIEIAKAVEKIFSVKVINVRTSTTRGKLRRIRYRKYGKTPDWKKAVVTLKKGDSIKVFEGA